MMVRGRAAKPPLRLKPRHGRRFSLSQGQGLRLSARIVDDAASRFPCGYECDEQALHLEIIKFFKGRSDAATAGGNAIQRDLGWVSSGGWLVVFAKFVLDRGQACPPTKLAFLDVMLPAQLHRRRCAWTLADRARGGS